MTEHEEQLQLWIEAYDFEALTPSQQELVLAHMTEEDYRQQRTTLLASQWLFEDEAPMLTPDPAILSSLQSRLKEKSEPAIGERLMMLFTARIPAYQAGLAVAATFLLLFWLRTPGVEYIETERIVYQPDVDTVTVVKEVLVEVPVERVRVIEKQVPAPPLQLPESTLLNNKGITPESDALLATELSRSFGNTALPLQELNQFVVGM